MGPKARVLLKYLLDHPERVLGKEELLAALWGTTVVTENSLVQLVLELRNALDDREQLIVKTVPRRGYMFVAPVEWQHDRPRTASVVRPRARWQITAGAAALLCVAAVVTLQVTRAPYSVDADFTGSFPVSVAPLVEADIDGEPSSFGRRIPATSKPRSSSASRPRCARRRKAPASCSAEGFCAEASTASASTRS